MTDSDPSEWQIHGGTVRTTTLDIDLNQMDYDELNIKGAVPVEVLEDLVAEWRGNILADSSREIQAENRTFGQCAAELEAVINDHD